MLKYILNEPSIGKLEERYVRDVLRSNWLSANGKHTRIFQEKFATYVGTKHALAVQSGTAALHLALKALGVGPSDHVILPNFSCGASISSVVQCGATPVVMDIEPDTFGLDCSRLEEAIKKYSPKAVQLVHVYGYPARDTMAVQKICKKHGVYLVEDASEALGAMLGNKRVGQFGDIGTFSIRSEKMIGIGEGGVVVTNNSVLYEKALLLASRSASSRSTGSVYWKKYFYEGEGYNYLLPHLLGAVARAQIERFQKEIFPQKVRVALAYRKLFSGIEGIAMQKVTPGAKSACWLNSILFNNMKKDGVRKLGAYLMSHGVEIRPGFWPLSDMKGFAPVVFGRQDVGRYIFEHLLVLPSAYNLKEADVKTIRGMVVDFINNEKTRR